MDRRTFVRSVAGIIGGATLAGCIAESTSFEQAPSDALQIQENSQDLISGTCHLEEGEWEGLTLWSEAGMQLSWTVEVSGSPIDVWVMTKEDLDKFREGDEFLYLRELSKFGIQSAKASGILEPGKMRMVFENSMELQTEPDGAVDIDFSATLSNPT